VFTDLPKPLHIVCAPDIDADAFDGHQYNPLHRVGLFHSVFHLDWYRCGLLITVPSGIPRSSAASSVNSLNVEPAW
jgi:hypothetical protein